MSNIRLVIFDIGGTIIEDHGQVVASFCAALTANGLPSSEAEIREFKGFSKRDVIKRFVEHQWGKKTLATKIEFVKPMGISGQNWKIGFRMTESSPFLGPNRHLNG
jgi:phosphoglycolate phosphatase-like HAD superfamily hydrolase